jgi:uncharacterized protein (DUF488 family)
MMPGFPAVTTLYTAGYAGLGVKALADWLVAHDALLADVRFRPSSRAAQWRQPAMRKAFGSRYLHIPALGNRNYKGGPVLLADPAAGVATVVEHLKRQRVVLLCVCESHATCHRAVAADLVRGATDVEVVHLTRADFTTEQLNLLTVR